MAGPSRSQPSQLLTPREQEVLALLRLGLTNAQIASRLGISLDGAKYHVSEIIGKLGVQNRREAAWWPERPPWWAAAATPIALFYRRAVAALPFRPSTIALAISAVALAALLCGLGLIALLLLRGERTAGPVSALTCPSQPAHSYDPNAELTFEQVADRVQEAATCPGYVLHLSFTGDVEAGPYSSRNETEIWVDLVNSQGRLETSVTFTSEEARKDAEERGLPPPQLRGAAVLIGDLEYSRQYYGDEQDHFDREQKDSCHGAGRAALELLLACELVEEGPTEELTLGIDQQTTYYGRRALAFTRSGISRGSDETYDTTARFYVDRETFLPLGRTGEGTLDIGETFPVSYDSPYTYSFVRADTLASGVFDPASLGFVVQDFEKQIRAARLDLPVYWLGTKLAGEGSLPSLVLDSVFIYGVPTPPGLEMPYPVVRLNYARAGEPDGKAIVTLKIYTEADWQAYRGESGEERGREIDLRDGRAVLERLLRPATPPGESFNASVYVAGAVVRVDAPLRFEDYTPSSSPYDSEAAMELLVRSLRPLD